MTCYEWNNRSWAGPPPTNPGGDAQTVCGKTICNPCGPSLTKSAPAPAVLDAPTPTLDLVANAKQLQSLEASIYANMEDLNRANPQAVDVQKELLARVNDVTNTKVQLFKLIEQRYHDAEDNLAHDRTALDAERRVLEIAEAQLAQVRANVVNERDYNTTQERIAEIDEYAFDSALGENKIIFTVFLGLIALAVELFIVNMLPGVLAKQTPANAWQPSDFFKTMMNVLMIITVIVTVVYAMKQTHDTMGRSNRIYSEFVFDGLYDHPSGNGSPGETVWEHDKKFLTTLKKDTEQTASNFGQQAGATIGSIEDAAKAGLQGIAHDTMAAAGTASRAVAGFGAGNQRKPVGGHLPKSAVADPAQSSGALAQTDQAPIQGAHPAGKHSAMVETFAAF
jgi:hypothetical protein